MSTQITPIKVLQSATYGIATKAALYEMGKALKGGDAVNSYFTLRAQAGALLKGILNNRGFMEVSNLGPYKGQEAYFYSEGNSDFLTAFVPGETFEERISNNNEYAALMAFQLGHDVGQVTYLRLAADMSAGGHAGMFTWKDLAPLVLQDIGRSATQSYGGVRAFLNNATPAAKAKTAKKAFQRAVAGAGVGLHGNTEFQTPNGNIVHFDVDHKDDASLEGIAESTNNSVISIAQSEFTEGISHALIIQNHTDKQITFKITHQNKASGLLLGPANSFKGVNIPGFIASGEETSITGVTTDRHVCGELHTLVASEPADGDIAYSIELSIEDTPQTIVAGFDLPQLAQNSSYIVFNPAGTPEEVFDYNKGKSSEEVLSLTHGGFGVSMAHNSTSSHTTSLSTGKEGYYYRTVMAIYDKTQSPDKSGSTPLDGFLFGDKI